MKSCGLAWKPLFSLLFTATFTAPLFLLTPAQVNAQSTKGLAPTETGANRVSASTLSDEAELAKPAVVRVENGCSAQVRSSKTQKVYTAIAGGFGSGYFVAADGVLVTNAHVVRASQTLKDCESDLMGNVIRQMIEAGEVNVAELLEDQESKVQQILDTLEIVTEVTPVQTVVMGNGDRLPYEVLQVNRREDVALLKVEVENAPALPLGDSDQVRLAESILTIGFPAVADGEPDVGGDSIVVDLRSNLEATINGGQISARKLSNTGSTLLQISAPVTHGSSGGPVLNARGEVVGMVTFGPEETGFAFAVTSNTIAKMLRKAGITQTANLTNQTYKEAIALFHQEQYGRALSKFLAVQSRFPYHGETKFFIQVCKTRINNLGNR